MHGGWLRRVRWRRRGAWMWPAVAVLTLLDALIGHARPASGDAQTLVGAALLAGVLNLIAVTALSRPIGALVRRVRRDLPQIVARDYAATSAVLAVGAALLAAGIVNHPNVVAHRRALQDAVARAQAWIGARAPAEFRAHLSNVSTVVIEPGNIYRTCVRSPLDARTYCVVVKTRLPFARSVSFAGYEPNAVFAGGAG